MCGIAGFNWNDGRTALKMSGALGHRGPDGVTFYADDSVSLGHSRLAIIDLSDKAKQPMSNEDQSLWIVHNGEIYNFEDLRDELGKKHAFVSNTDTEVILHAYEEWGTGALERFNGMWAFCLYDRKAQLLVLSRDRAGEKPLYYYHDGDRFIFASELKAILLHEGVPKDISKEALDLYLSLGYIPSPWTIYEGIAKLEPRQKIIYDLRTHELKKESYYEIPNYAPVRDRRRLIAEGRELLWNATRLRLRADVPVGAFLSGGLDSSSVVAAMTRFVNPDNLHTFSIGFEREYDETRYMEIVKDAFKTSHHHRAFTERDFETNLDALAYFYDEPFADSASAPTYELSRLARQWVKVALSGDGGDEIFGGYRMHQRAARFALIKKIPAPFRKAILQLVEGASAGSLIGTLRKKLRLSLAPDENFYTESDREGVYQPEVYRRWSAMRMRELLQRSGGNLTQAVCSYDLYYHTLPDNYLAKVDRASMAHGLEVRCPLLDIRFLEFAARIPAEWKANRRKNKILMRQIITSIVPPAVAKRRKHGFTPPVREWLRNQKYRTLIREATECLTREGVLDKAWGDFFGDTVLKSGGDEFHLMGLRMLVFWKWWQRWMERSAQQER